MLRSLSGSGDSRAPAPSLLQCPPITLRQLPRVSAVFAPMAERKAVQSEEPEDRLFPPFSSQPISM